MDWTPKSGHCREVAVRAGLTVFHLRLPSDFSGVGINPNLKAYVETILLVIVIDIFLPLN